MTSVYSWRFWVYTDGNAYILLEKAMAICTSRWLNLDLAP